MYNTDNNVLIGSPTGSGKTIMSELAALRIFNLYPTKKVSLLLKKSSNILNKFC